MNSNVFFGVIAFVIWSTFSTWFYVNFIKEFDQVKKIALTDVPAYQLQEVDSSTTTGYLEIVTESSVPIKVTKRFTFNKNTTNLIHTTAIKQFTDSLQSVLTDKTFDISIIGQACDLGTEKHNYKLGMDRAKYVEQTLMSSNITWPQMTIKSEGETNPIVPNSSEKNRIKNRAVTIHITTKP
jgi:outer membrane protein OmpA-like peptidoglycan-associated protein